LFGRCGRQGDPGSCEALLLWDDEILKKYLPQALIRAVWACNRRRLPVSGGLVLQIAKRTAEQHLTWLRPNRAKQDQRLKEILEFPGPLD
jgi:preprotein translocase subunit SecA